MAEESENEGSLVKLNGILFDQLARLNNDDLKGDSLETEVKRAGAITDLSKEVLTNAKTVLDAAKLKAEYSGIKSNDLLRLENL